MSGTPSKIKNLNVVSRKDILLALAQRSGHGPSLRRQ